MVMLLELPVPRWLVLGARSLIDLLLCTSTSSNFNVVDERRANIEKARKIACGVQQKTKSIDRSYPIQYLPDQPGKIFPCNIFVRSIIKDEVGIGAELILYVSSDYLQ